MIIRSLIGATALTVASVAAAACGGTTSQPAAENAAAPASAPAPAAGGATVRGDLLADWREQKDMMLKAADAMPEDKFGYKSTPQQRSYGEQVMHIASINVDLLKMVGGQAPAPAFTAESAKTKADIMKALAESYDYGIALLDAQSDAWVTETIDAGFLGQSTRGRLFWFLLGHSNNTYGQMVVYLRLNGVVPPASRGV